MTPSFEIRPSGTQIAAKAWRSSFEAFGKMKLLFLTALAILLVFGLAVYYVPYLQFYVFGPPARTLESGTLAIYLAVEVVCTLVFAAVAAPAAVAVHRYILTDRITTGSLSFGPRYTKAFFLWLAGMQMMLALLNVPLFSIPEESSFASVLVMFAVAILGVVISIRLIMVFPAIATEVPSEHWRARLGQSWKQMKGHSWLLARAAIIAFLPLISVNVILWVLFGGLREAPDHGDLQYWSQLGLGLSFGIIKLAGIVLGAAVVSWLYAWVRQQPSAVLEPTADIMPN